jgi:hypothetical protein
VRLAARAAAVTAVVALAAGSLVLPPAAPAAAQDAALLTLLARTAWVGEGFDFQVTVRATAAPEGSQLRLSVHDEVRSRSEFERSLDGLGLRRELFPLPPVALDAADPDGDGAISLVVPLVERDGVEPVAIDDPGTYPVEVELLDADDEVLATLRTHLVRLPPAGAEPDLVPLAVAVVIPVHADPVDLDPRAQAPTEAPVLEQLDALTAALAAHPEVPVTISATPESIAAAAATDPELVEELAAAVAAPASEVLANTWVRLDDAAWQRADAGALTRQLARGDQALSTALDLDTTEGRLVRSGRAAPTVAAMVGHGASLVIVDEADLEPLDTTLFPYTVARPFALSLDDGTAEGSASVPALGSDPALAALAAEVDADPVLAAHQILADLSVIGADEPESARVATLVLPADAARSAQFLDALLAGLEAPAAANALQPGADPVLVGSTASTALARVDPTAEGDGDDGDEPVVRTFAETEEATDVTELAEALADEDADVASYRAVFGAEDPIAQRCEVVLATSASSDLDAGTRNGAVNATRSVREEILGGIQPPESQRVRLTDREGQIQLVVTNASGAPADVDLLLRGDRLVFPDAPDGTMRVRLEEIQTRIDLRVEARSSGDAPLEIGLASPDGRLDLGQSRITVRATAISGVGIGLMVAALLFLAVWWTRTIRRERRSRRAGRLVHAKRAT